MTSRNNEHLENNDAIFEDGADFDKGGVSSDSTRAIVDAEAGGIGGFDDGDDWRYEVVPPVNDDNGDIGDSDSDGYSFDDGEDLSTDGIPSQEGVDPTADADASADKPDARKFGVLKKIGMGIGFASAFLHTGAGVAISADERLTPYVEVNESVYDVAEKVVESVTEKKKRKQESELARRLKNEEN